MSSLKLAAGETVESRCTKCRSVLNHTIVAMIDGAIVKVKCDTCGGMHKYHPPVSATAAKKTSVAKKPATPRAVKKDAATIEQEEWESLKPGFKLDRVSSYSMEGKFRVNELVDHPVFGLGVVRLLPGPSKMEVLFQGGKKLLKCR
jgi:hypothetical protein